MDLAEGRAALVEAAGSRKRRRGSRAPVGPRDALATRYAGAMSKHTTYACSACGAQVDEQCRKCAFCKAPVATVRCATCFHMNVREAAYCSGCGRQLGLEPIGTLGTLACPVCKTALEAYESPPAHDPDAPPAGALFDCGTCGGQFVEHALLQDLLHQHEHGTYGQATPLPPTKPDPRNNYIPCPECAALMNRKNFGATSGVIVDVCKKHGTWFDLGELPRVLAFVSTGGLERAQKRAAEEQAQSLRAARIAASIPPTPVSSHDHGAAYHAGESLTRMFVDLLLR
jgi:Zn-finger nucleic acid-binding protein